MSRLYHLKMLNKITSLLIDIFFPSTYLQKYLSSCSYMEFIRRFTPRIQKQDRLFSPFYYKDSLIKDCVIELKERNNQNVARLFSYTLSQYIQREINTIIKNSSRAHFFLIPVPQHISKTKEKGFLHTDTLCVHIKERLSKHKTLLINPCIQKTKQTKRLHDLNNRKKRFKTITKTMTCYLTKRDIKNGFFFIIDDVHTTGATFKEARRTLLESGVLSECIYFISIAH